MFKRPSLIVFLTVAVFSSGLAPASHAQNSDSRRSLKVSILEQDQKLSAKIKLEYVPVDSKGFMQSLWNKTGYEFAFEGGAQEFAHSEVSVGTKTVTVRAVMESYAFFYRIRWKKTKRGYSLIVGDHELESVFGAANPFAAIRNAAGEDFLNSAKKLPAEQRNLLMSGASLPFSALPEEMQSATRKMVVSLESEYPAAFTPGEVSLKLGSERVALSSKPQEGFTVYKLQLRGVGFSFNDFDARKEHRATSNDQLMKVGKTGAIFDPERYELTKEELQKLPVLKQSVSIHLKNITLVQTLATLHQKYGIDFLCASPKRAKQKADIDISAVTLAAAVKQLEAVYKETKWIWTPSNFLVVRGPGGTITVNRTPQKEGSTQHSP